MENLKRLLSFKVSASLAVAQPYRACQNLKNKEEIRGKLVLLERGECMFVEKVRNVQAAGGLGAIIVGTKYLLEVFEKAQNIISFVF